MGDLSVRSKIPATKQKRSVGMQDRDGVFWTSKFPNGLPGQKILYENHF